MFDNPALDVAIGLIFIFLIYSLLASVILEIVAKLFDLRARNLVRALRRMLQDAPLDTRKNKYTFWAWITEFRRDVDYFFTPIEKDTFLDQFYQAPTIRYLGENSARSKPSSIYPSTFSQTIVQLLRGKYFDSRTQIESQKIDNTLQSNPLLIDPQTLQHLRDLFEDARQDITQFRINLENWFDQMMERNTGWYARQSQLLLFWIGLLLAIGFNIDSLTIVNILLHDDTAREQVVQLAISRQQQYGQIITSFRDKAGADTSQLIKEAKLGMDQSRQLIDSLQADGFRVQSLLGLGHHCTCKADSQKTEPKQVQSGKPSDPKQTNANRVAGRPNQVSLVSSNTTSQSATPGRAHQQPECPSLLLSIVGWLLTALAISLGGPFWYDILCKLIAVRQIIQRTDKPTTRTNSSTQPPILG